jgi:hypothetical protein
MLGVAGLQNMPEVLNSNVAIEQEQACEMGQHHTRG